MNGRAFLAAALFVGVTSGVARAAPDEAAGRAAFAEGNKHFTDGDLIAALASFRDAYAKFPNPKIQLNIGTTLRKLGRYAEAATAYEAFLASPEADASKMDETRDALHGVLAHVGTLRVAASGSGLTLRIDHGDVGVSPGPITIRADAGPHLVEGIDASGKVWSHPVEVIAGSEAAVTLGVGAPEPSPIATPTTATKPPPAEPATPVGPYVLGGVGVAAVGVGVVLAVVWSGKNSAAKKQRDGLAAEPCFASHACAPYDHSVFSATKTLSTAAWISGGLGVAAIAGAVGWKLSTRGDPTTGVGVWADPRAGAGATWRGTW